MEPTAKLTLVENQTDDGNVPVNILLKENTTLGRAVTCDVTMGSLQISRKHCSFEVDNGVWFVRDLSTNGMSIVSQTRRLVLTKNTPHKLEPNDIIHLVPTGTLVYKFQKIENRIEPLQPSVLLLDSDSESLMSVEEEPRPSPSKRKLISSPTTPSKKRKNDTQDIEGLLEEQRLKIAEMEKKNELLEGQLSSLRTQKIIYEEEKRAGGSLGGKVLEVLESELSCCVCAGVFIEPTTSPCGHTYCAHCITEWLKKKPECPICRAPLHAPKKHVELQNVIQKLYPLLGADHDSKRLAQLNEREKEVALAKEQMLVQVQQQQRRNALIPNDFVPFELLARGVGGGRRRGRRRNAEGLPGGNANAVFFPEGLLEFLRNPYLDRRGEVVLD